MRELTSLQFDIFARLIASGDINRTAMELDLPAREVETNLRLLEDRVGHRLFDRSFGVHVLTPAGRHVVAALDRLSDQMTGRADADELLLENVVPSDEPAVAVAPAPAPAPHVPAMTGTAEAASTPPVSSPVVSLIRPQGQVRHLTLAAHAVIFSHFQESLTAFEEANPDIRITVELAPLAHADAWRMLERGDADIAYYYALDRQGGGEGRYAWSEPVSLFAAADHALGRLDHAMAADLAQTPYIALPDHDLLRELMEAALERTGLRVGEARTVGANLYEVLRAVQTGRGYCAALGSMARDFARMPNITRIRYAQGMPQVAIFQGVAPARADDAAVQALSEYLFR